MKNFQIRATNRFCVVITNNFGKLAFVIEAEEPNEAAKTVLATRYSGFFTKIEAAPIFDRAGAELDEYAAAIKLHAEAIKEFADGDMEHAAQLYFDNLQSQVMELLPKLQTP